MNDPIKTDLTSNNDKPHWESPTLIELDIRSTENNIGSSGDGGMGGLNEAAS